MQTGLSPARRPRIPPDYRTNDRPLRENPSCLLSTTSCSSTPAVAARSARCPCAAGHAPPPRAQTTAPVTARTFLKQSNEFLYMSSPMKEPVRWFCILVFTRSIG